VRRPFSLLYPCEIAEVSPESRAEVAGLQPGDRIVAVGDMTFPTTRRSAKRIQAHPETPLRLLVERGGKQLALDAVPDSLGSLGFMVHPAAHYEGMFETTHLDYGPLSAISAGYSTASETLKITCARCASCSQRVARRRWAAWSPSAASSTPGGTGKFLAQHGVLLADFGLHEPAAHPRMDGGHVMFTLYEMIAGRPASEQFLERAQMIGIVLLLT
jgi:regulator of sigma E protease